MTDLKFLYLRSGCDSRGRVYHDEVWQGEFDEASEIFGMEIWYDEKRTRFSTHRFPLIDDFLRRRRWVMAADKKYDCSDMRFAGFTTVVTHFYGTPTNTRRFNAEIYSRVLPGFDLISHDGEPLLNNSIIKICLPDMDFWTEYGLPSYYGSDCMVIQSGNFHAKREQLVADKQRVPDMIAALFVSISQWNTLGLIIGLTDCVLLVEYYLLSMYPPNYHP